MNKDCSINVFDITEKMQDGKPLNIAHICSLIFIDTTSSRFVC